MAEKKEELPEHISKYSKLRKKAKKMIETMDRHHRGAYDAAVDAVLTEDGQVDMELLEDRKIQDRFSEKMSDYYISKAKQLFKVKGDAKFDDLEKELLMNAYTGTTKDQLQKYVRRHGKVFTFDHFHEKLRPKLMEKMHENLNEATFSHFKDEHISDILRYTGSSGFIDKEKIRLPEATGILEQYEEMGVVPEKSHKRALYYKKQK